MSKSLKKGIILLGILIGVFAIYDLSGKKGITGDIPEVNVIVVEDNKKYEAVHGEGTWIKGAIPKGSVPGSSILVDSKKIFLEECSFIEVKAGEKLKFDIPYKEFITKVTIKNFDINLNKVIDGMVLDSTYEFEVPMDSNEYFYALEVLWDEYHVLDYQFKVRVS